MASTDYPDYYLILNVPKDASTEDIIHAYERESLKSALQLVMTHPDMLFDVSNEEKRVAKKKFQLVADAYRVLSNPQRRHEYDCLFTSSGAGNGQQETPTEQPGNRPNADREELLRPEVEQHPQRWTWLGAACGAGLGFMTANIPGLVVGARVGHKLGAIRDAKGKNVAAVLEELAS